MIIETNLVLVPYANARVWSPNRYPSGEVFEWFATRQMPLGRMGGWSFIEGRALAHHKEPVLGILLINGKSTAEQFAADFEVSEEEVRPIIDAFAVEEESIWKSVVGGNA